MAAFTEVSLRREAQRVRPLGIFLRVGLLIFSNLNNTRGHKTRALSRDPHSLCYDISSNWSTAMIAIVALCRNRDERDSLK